MRIPTAIRLLKAVLAEMSPLLLELWLEQHPAGHEQTTFAFRAFEQVAQHVPLFVDLEEMAVERTEGL